MTKEQQKLIDEIYDETGIEMEWTLKNEKPETVEELMEQLEELVNEIQVIYHRNAIDYLAEHDQSLTDSLAIADEMGFEIKALNSELLATLLKQQKAGEALSGYQERLEELFYQEK